MAKNSNNDYVAFAIAIVSILIGLFAVWISVRYLEIKPSGSDLYYAILILMPILVYAISSGKLKKLSAGGLDAEFGDAVKQKLDPIPIESFAENAIVINKDNMQKLNEQISNLRDRYGYGYKSKKNRPIVLTLFLGERDRNASNTGNDRMYDEYVAFQYIRDLSQFREFRLAVILNKYNKVVAWISSDRLFDLLNPMNNGPTREFIKAINDGNIKELCEIPGIQKITMKKGDTNLDALRAMDEHGLETLAAVDENGSLIGVIDRDRLLDELLAKSLLGIE